LYQQLISTSQHYNSLISRMLTITKQCKPQAAVINTTGKWQWMLHAIR